MDEYEEEDDAAGWLHELEAYVWGDFGDEAYLEALEASPAGRPIEASEETGETK
jgi:hypothetical protein